MITLPSGPFGCFVADPPWRFNDSAARGAAEHHYETMSLEEICRMPVEEIAAPTAHLYLWTPDAMLLDGSAALVCKLWGFKPVQLFTWLKEKDGSIQMGAGHYLRHCTEVGIFAIRQPKRGSGISAAAAVRDRGVLAAFWSRIARTRGAEAVASIQAGAQVSGVAQMSDAEIDAEIADVRSERLVSDNLIRAQRTAHSAKPEELQDIAERLSPGPYLELFARRQRPGWTCWGNQA